MRKIMLSAEFLDSYNNSRKEFSDIELHYSDFNGRNFEGLKIRNSKLFFVTFRHCNLKNVVFEDCEIIFGAFGFSEIKNARFVRCQIEYTGFTGAKIDNSKMIDTRLSWISLIDATLGGLEIRNCSEFHVFRNISELTPSLLARALTEIQPLMHQMDFDMQQKIKEIIDSFMKQYKLQASANPPAGKSYGAAAGSGYRMLDALIDRAIRTYGSEPPYSQKKPYETKPKYK